VGKVDPVNLESVRSNPDPFWAAGAPTDAGGGLLGLLPMVLILGVFYFMLILPARRRQKKLQEMIHNLKRGDKIITTGGIFGTVMGISDRLVQLRIADQVTIEISKNGIAALQNPDGSEPTS
jgi:preprotein translocase subunit YajC